MSEQPDDEGRKKRRRDDDSEALALYEAVTTLLDASGVVTSRLGRRIRSELIVVVVRPLDPDPVRSFELRAWERPVVSDLIDPKDLDDHYSYLLEALRTKVEDSAIKSAADPAWDVLTQKWQTTDPGNFAGVSDRVRGLDERMFGAAMSSIGVPGPVDAALVFVVPLPVDEDLAGLATLGDVLGIVFALTTGHALMACASLESLMHEGIIRLFKEAIKGALEEQHVTLRFLAKTTPTSCTDPVSSPEALGPPVRTVSDFDSV